MYPVFLTDQTVENKTMKNIFNEGPGSDTSDEKPGSGRYFER